MQTFRYLIYLYIFSLYFTIIFGSPPIKMEWNGVDWIWNGTAWTHHGLEPKMVLMSAPRYHPPCPGEREIRDRRGICRKILPLKPIKINVR